MNFATVCIVLILAVLLGLAVRYLVKNGMCAACEDRDACKSAHKADGAGLPAGCGGKCSSCRYYELEKQAAAAKQTHPADR